MAATAISAGCSRSQLTAKNSFKAEYRMQVNVGPRAAWGQGAARFAELAQEKTAGRIRIRPYYNSELLRDAYLNRAGLAALIAECFETLFGGATAAWRWWLSQRVFLGGALSGSGPATTAAVGLILIVPMMQRGYAREFAAAVDAYFDAGVGTLWN